MSLCLALIDHKRGRVLVCALDKNHPPPHKPGYWRICTEDEEKQIRRKP